MDIIFVLIPVSLLLLGAAVWVFFWAVGSGQYDDLDSPAWRVVMDDDRAPPAHRGHEDADAEDGGDDG